MILLEFTENNSGGHWWLSLEDYDKLEKAGWTREEWTIKFRISEGRPHSMTKQFPTRQMGIAEWEWLTGKDAYEEGCSCCGIPFSFYDREVETNS